MEGIQHIEIDESLCYDCLKEVPPNLYKNKGSKGEGKCRKQCKRDTDWVFCDSCRRWYHCLWEKHTNVLCVKINNKYECKLESFMCVS